MKSIISALLAIFVGFAAKAGTLYQLADSAYAADNFAEAAELYRQIISTEGTSPELLYNLGNCYYRLGQPGKAIVSYERALRIDPTFADARTNLAFVNSRIVDRPGERGSFMSNTFDRAATAQSANSWAWIAFALFVVTAAGIALYLFAENVTMRKIGFFGAGALFILFAVSIVLAFRGRAIATNHDVAIITTPSVILSTSPREPKDRNEEAMLLHEGSKMIILDSISAQNDTTGMKWLDVQVDNAHRAWIKSTAVERI